MRVAITGATGLVGNALSARLLERGDGVVALTRNSERALASLPNGAEAASWTVGEPDLLAPVLCGVDAVVNLAGEPILGRRWSRKVMEEIRRSRVEGTRTVVEAMAKAEPRPTVLANASAVGFYGPRGDEEIDEETGPGRDYLASVCTEWEAEARNACAHGVRVALVRVGIVLAREGGALAKMLPPFKAFLGGPVGSGRQGMPWIHLDDLVGIFLHALDDERASGPLNGTAPNPVTNRVFSKALGNALGRPSFLPAPRFALRIVMGKVATVLTNGQLAVPRKTIESGYAFRFSQLGAALADLLADRSS